MALLKTGAQNGCAPAKAHQWGPSQSLTRPAQIAIYVVELGGIAIRTDDTPTEDGIVVAVDERI